MPSIRRTSLLFGFVLAEFTLIAAPKPADLLGNLPLTFVENRGQTDSHARFIAHTQGARIFLTEDGATFAIGSGERRSAVKLSIPGSGVKPTLTGEAETGGVSSFLKGSDRSKWAVSARQFRSVRSREVKPGVDVIYYGNGQELEYDIVLRPGANANDLRFRFDGADKLTVNREGDLVVHTDSGDMIQHRPSVWQLNENGKTRIGAAYRLKTRNIVAVSLGHYDPARELVIDPVLSFSTYLGGKNEDSANAVVVDSSNNIYITGFTASSDFPTSIGAYRVALNGTANDAFVTKLNSTGTAVLYSTLIGGSGYDVASAIAVDSAGNVIIGGSTQSSDFPTTAGSLAPSQGNRSLFVTKLNPTGTALVYSTFWGAANGYQESLTGIALDPSANAYLVGSTSNSSFPTTPGAFSTSFNRGSQVTYTDAYVAKLNSTGSSLLYSTFLGGSQSDAATAITLDSSNQAYVIGSTTSSDFPTSTTAFQKMNGFGQYTYNSAGFVACVNASGSALTYSTYLNGSNGAVLSAIALDSQQNAYIAGQARSADFPTTTGAFSTTYSGNSEAFVSKLNYTGSSLVYSTFLGGSADDAAHAIAVDGSGSAIVTGTTNSTTFPVTPGSFPPVQQTTYYNSTQNVPFLTKLNTTGTSVLYSTQFGSGVTTIDRGLALDTAGNAVVVGSSLSRTLPTTVGAFQRVNSDLTGSSFSYGSAFIAKIDLNSTTMCSLSLSTSAIAAPLAGTTGTISVTVNAGCPWEASALDINGNTTFVTLSSISGVGNGSFTYTVPSNYMTSSSRTASIKVGSATVSVTQPAGSCLTPGFSPIYQNLDFNGGLNSVSVQLPPGCYFNPIATVPWIQISSNITANGSASVYYFVPRNDYAARGGYINISGTLFPILQTGGSCAATLGSSSLMFASRGGTGVIPFTVSPSACQWTALSYVPWIRLTNSSGSGSGFDSFSVSPNPGSISRFGQVLIAGQLFTVTQSGGSAAVPSSYTINTVAGTGTTYNYLGGFGGDGGSALGALLSNPLSVAYDTANNLYIADSGNYRIRKVDTLGNIATIAGNGTAADSGDGGPAISASLFGATGLAFDTSGTLYFSTTYRLRDISPGGIINTAAGTGASGSPADGSPAASAIPAISGVATDSSGGVYLGDAYGYRIRRLASGVLSFYAGTGFNGFNGDGMAPLSTQLTNPRAFAADASGAIYFADGSRIRKIAGGTVSTVAGGGSGDGEGVTATGISVSANALAVDNQGSLFYLDNSRLRRVTNGIVTTIAGTSNSSNFTGDGGPALSASFNNPAGLAVDKYGNIAVADANNNRIRLLTPVYSPCAYSLSSNNLSVSGVGGVASITVSTTAACSYDNTGPIVSWLGFDPGGTGTGAVHINYTANGTTPRSATIYIAGQQVTISQAAGTYTAPSPTKAGVMQPQYSAWALDSNGNGGFDSGDRYFPFLALSTDIALTGDWTGDGHTKIGVYRSGFFVLDTNNNGQWDGPSGGDSFIALGGQPGDIPVVGDWNGDGRTKVGIYRRGFWILDTNGNGVFDAGDQFLAFGGNTGEQPVLGDWNGDGKTKIGFMYNGTWVLDYNGNGTFDSADRIYSFPYAAGDKAIVGDWNGTHTAKIGIYRAGFWILDYNGNGVYDGPSGGDKFYAFGGNPGEIPFVGDWNGSGTTKIGYYFRGFWCQDYNGDGQFNSGDRFFALGGSTGEQPIVGAW